MAETTEFLEEFIECYHEHSVLWDTTNKEYYQNRANKVSAYEELLKIMKKYKKEASIADVKRKINTLRSTFRKELKKIKQSESSGADEIYQPTVWWFESMDFLTNVAKPSFSSFVDKSEIEDESIEAKVRCRPPKKRKKPRKQDKLTACTYLVNEDTTRRASEADKSEIEDDSIDAKVCSPPLKRRKTTSAQDRLMNIACKYLVNEETNIRETAEDIYFNIAKTWADKLRTLSQKRQLMVEKKINDILFEEQMAEVLVSEEDQVRQKMEI